MKRSIFTIILSLIYLLLPSAPTITARADTPYYGYISTTSVYFYTQSQTSEKVSVFLLPYSYYVRIIGEDAEYYTVEYLTDGTHSKKLYGYAKKVDIIPVDYVPQLPYLYLTIDVTYTLENADADNSFSQITFTCGYYGDYFMGNKTYAYILREGQFGYVVKPDDLYYPKNEEYDLLHKQQEQKVKKEKPTYIAVIILLCLLIPTICALILKTNKKDYFDE